MILSVSRRTDIPSFYAPWFFRRLEERFVYVRHPRKEQQVSSVDLSPELLDGIVFWTKNPLPMKQYLDSPLLKCPYYFQFTLNPYGKDMEPFVPNKQQKIIPALVELSEKIGKHRVMWRYDPIILSETYTMEYHKTYFEALVKRLHPYTNQCTISFLDYLSHTCENTKELKIFPENKTNLLELVEYFSRIAKKYHINLFSCGEEMDLTSLGIPVACCINKEQLECQEHYYLDVPKDKNQRAFCQCDVAIDVGMYDSCVNGCRYCYANRNHDVARLRHKKHNPESPLLYGALNASDEIKKRLVISYKDHQERFF